MCDSWSAICFCFLLPGPPKPSIYPQPSGGSGFGFRLNFDWFSYHFFDASSCVFFLFFESNVKFWPHLGALLGRCWDHFGRLLGWFFEHFVNKLGKSLWYRFLMLLRCPPNLDFWALASTGANFLHFPQVVVDIDFGFQNFPKSSPKRSQDGPKRVPKRCQKVFEILVLFGRVEKSKKVTLKSLRDRFGRNMAPKSGPKRPPKSTKNR